MGLSELIAGILSKFGMLAFVVGCWLIWVSDGAFWVLAIPFLFLATALDRE